MTALVRTLFAAAAVAGLVAAAGPSAAQEKKEAKKKAAAGVVEFKQGKDDKYRFTVRDGDGKFLAMSGPGGFETKAEAVKALEALKDALATAKAVDVKKAAGKDDDEEMKDEKAPKKKGTDKKDKGGN